MRRVIQPLRPACCGTNYRKSAKPLQQPRRKRSCLRRARERGRPRHARFVRARKLVTCVVTIWSGFFFFFLMPFRSSFAFCLRGARRAPQAQACKCLLHISIGRRLKRIEKTRHEGNHTVQREYIRMATFLLRRNSCFTQIAGPILLSLQSMDAKKELACRSSTRCRQTEVCSAIAVCVLWAGCCANEHDCMACRGAGFAFPIRDCLQAKAKHEKPTGAGGHRWCHVFLPPPRDIGRLPW